MLERERLESKKISKTQAVTSVMGLELPADDVHVGPSDYVPWLTDRKWAHIRLEGEAFGDVPLTAEVKLEVWDSPNSAGIVTDAVRCCKLALNHGVGGPLVGPSAYLMKSPPEQYPDPVARQMTEDFIAEHGGAPKLPGPRPKVSGGQPPRPSSPGAAGPARMLRPCPARRFSIAQVTPWPWEQHHEVNRFVERLSDELCARGHRVVVVAPSDSRELVREGRAKVKRAAHRTPTPCSPSRACASMLAVGQSLPFRRGGSVSLPLDVSRTLEELLDRCELDFVHVHEPFAPSAASAALRHSRALNVGTFHSTTERFVSTQVARQVVELLFGRLDGRTASFAATRDLVERYFPGDYRVIQPGADLLHRAGRRTRAARDRLLGRGGARRAAPVPARAAPAADGPRLARHDLAARPGLGAGGQPVAAPARPRAAGRARATAPRPSTWPAPTIAVAASAGAAPAPQLVLRALAGGAVPVVARLPQYEEALRDGELGLLFEPRDAVTLAAQLERLIAEPELVAQLRGAGSSRRDPSSSGRASADEFEELYEEIAAPPSRQRAPGGPAAAAAARASSTSTCTCTPTTRPTAPPRSTRCSTPPSRSGSARSRSPTTTRSRARSRRASGPTGSR